MNRASFCALFVAVFLPLKAVSYAGWISSRWEPVVASADLVAFVECEVTKGPVAEYTVLVSIKGPGYGSRVTIAARPRFTSDVPATGFPYPLVGTRLWVAANKSTVAARPLPRLFGQPADWRNIESEAEYLSTQKLFPHPDHDTACAELKQFATLKPEEQEVRSLHAVIASLFPNAQFLEEKDLILLIDRITALPGSVPAVKESMTRILYEGIGPIGTAHLERKPGKSSFEESLLKSLRERSGKLTFQPPLPPDTRTLERLRLVLNQPGKEFSQAFELLTVYDPDTVADYLVRLPSKDPERRPHSYVLGTYFGHQCGKNRIENFQKLLSASNPYIRTAGAIYLSFEDQKQGMEKMRELLWQEGLPGVWAAVALAQRGDKSAMPRALEALLGRESWEGEEATLQRYLWERMVILLSNSARSSGLSQPPLPALDNALWNPVLFESCTKWWAEKSSELTLFDPSLPALEKQKLD